jgi:hypothetical protein
MRRLEDEDDVEDEVTSDVEDLRAWYAEVAVDQHSASTAHSIHQGLVDLLPPGMYSYRCCPVSSRSWRLPPTPPADGSIVSTGLGLAAE